MSRSYMESLGEISSSANSAKHAANIIAAMTPPPSTSVAGAELVAQPKSDKPSVAKSVLGLAPGVVAGGIGALTWSNHRVLGFLTGHALGSNVYPMFRGNPQERKNAVCRLGIEGAGVAGALMYKRHRVFGWIMGVAAGTAVAAFVPDSPVRSEWKKFKESL